MTSPSARKRQRSVRLIVASSLIVLAAVLVAVAFVSNIAPAQLGSAIAAVVLGAAAVRITFTETIEARVAAAADRAEQARAYNSLASARAGETREFTTRLSKNFENRLAGRDAQIAQRNQMIAEREQSIEQLQAELAAAQRDLATVAASARRAEKDRDEMARSLDASETRAAEAIVRVAELEAELDAMQAELVAWRDEAAARQRKAI